MNMIKLSQLEALVSLNNTLGLVSFEYEPGASLSHDIITVIMFGAKCSSTKQYKINSQYRHEALYILRG